VERAEWLERRMEILDARSCSESRRWANWAVGASPCMRRSTETDPRCNFIHRVMNKLPSRRLAELTELPVEFADGQVS
jgi:hypothetical protein